MSDVPAIMMRQIQSDIAAAYAFELVREFVGNDVTAARIMAATPMFGPMPDEARRILAETLTGLDNE